MSECELSGPVKRSLLELYQRHNIPLETQPMAGVGENAYGQVLRVRWPTLPETVSVVVKMAPKNEARREHMHVVDYYAREVFMYQQVFPIFRELSPDQSSFTVTPALLANGLQAPEEFLIFEDLAGSGFHPNSRSSMPTYDIVICTLKAVAELHACSFVLQHKNPEKFKELVGHVKKDNLFTVNIEAVTIEFGKAQLRKARNMLGPADGQPSEVAAMQEVLQQCEKHLKSLALYCVNGEAQAPHSVICHGDFWNNNILYRLEPHPVEAKIIDFQMSRYAPPVLDIIRYLCCCTDKSLRDEHYSNFMDVYYDTLSQKVAACDLQIEELYPRSVFTRQLQLFGVYGLIMGAFSLPFFLSNANEMIDIDTVSEAIQDISSSKTDDPQFKDLIEEYEVLNERTLPIFKRRMVGIVQDLIKYKMVEPLFQFDP